MTTAQRDVVNVDVERTFNHDLLVCKDDQDRAAARWPLLAHVLIDHKLIGEFKPHEAQAKALKRRVQLIGSAAVLLMLGALLGYTTELTIAAQGTTAIPYLGVLSELSAVVALVLALLASKYGPFRRRWLRHRFVTEVLRQWHFRRLLNGRSIQLISAASNETLPDVAEHVTALMHNLRGAVGAKMNALTELRHDPLDPIPRASLPLDGAVRAQLLEAYRVLRLDHQLGFAMYKLSVDDKTFAALSLLALSNVAELLAGATLVLALGCSIVRLFVPFEWAPIAGISLATTGVAVRVWRDGFAVEAERERYQELSHQMALLTTRWENAEDDEQRFRVAEEVERTALEELRAFIRSHEQAQFLF